MFFRLNFRLFVIVFKVIVVLIIITFVWFHLKFNNEIVYQKSETKLTKVPNISQTFDKMSQKSMKELRETIESINSKQEVLNYEMFGPLLTNDLVIIIQVHNRVQYLSDLIQSLERTKGINQSLVVFSHDIFEPQINAMIASIKFCKVIQIFFPNSLQLNGNTFPGLSPNDCPRDITKEEALRIGCNNAMNGDTYGHYREPDICQTKHHWWWKINTLFDKLDITAHHFGSFMFLEEDHYLAPDAIHVFKLMKEYQIRWAFKYIPFSNGFNSVQSNGQDFRIITLGLYSVSLDLSKNGNKIETSKWISSRHNMGFVIDRSVWNEIKSCSQQFCTYDDYNWDWSLQYLSERCLPSPLKTLVVSTPRVFHTGGCGLHHKTSKCDNKQIIQKIENNLKASEKYLFPEQLFLKKTFQKRFTRPKPNGGWSDPRDHSLCINATKKR